jgi:hypothetical protein
MISMTETGITINKFILSQSRETKIKWMKLALEEGNFNVWFQLTQILLKYPIHEGGIETEVIDKIFKEYNL